MYTFLYGTSILAYMLSISLCSWLAWGVHKFGTCFFPTYPSGSTKAYVTFTAKFCKLGMYICLVLQCVHCKTSQLV
ncbi:hypothetical protein EDC04DRAFT_2717052 [Pisolithus marmoratus]|nr:hypothetical protein EDC04DRAFT_2717052 [Pisolithus marmoratus]